MPELTDFRRTKDNFMGSDHQSPLIHDQQHDFQGLSYFDEDRSLRFELTVEEFSSQDPVEMQTSTGDVATYLRWGKVRFQIDGQAQELTAYKGVEDELPFLPFADATSGKETYPSGRYIETQPLPDGKLLVDFNYAYNPYCAYNDQWSCPLTPFENRLPVSISAGEKTFK